MSLNRRLANFGNVIDSATTGHFLSKGDSDGQFSTVAYSSIVGTPTVLDSALTSQLIDSSYVQLRQTSSAAGLDSALITTLVDSSYVAARAGSGGGGSGFVKYQYTATNNQTVFQDSASSGVVLAYSKDHILVHYNGVVLPASDYTATNGNSVELATGADSGAIISIASWSHGSDFGGNDIPWYGDRGLWIGGINSSNTGQTVIDYVNITSTGNATDFGDLSNTSSYRQTTVSNSSRIAFAATGSNVEYITSSTTGNSSSFGNLTDTRNAMAGVSDGTTGCFGGGSNNVIDKITIATTGNAIDFGDLTVSRSRLTSGKGGTTRGLFIGGGSTSNVIDYITIAVAGNATDFGDVSSYGSHDIGGAGNETRVLYAAGQHTNNNTLKRIEYVNPATTGNGTSFGNVNYWSHMLDGANNGSRACWSGYNTSEPGTSAQNHIEYITIDTTGNAIDFGDLTSSRAYVGGASGNAA